MLVHLLREVSLCPGTHCKLIVKQYARSTKLSRYSFIIFSEIQRDFCDVKAAWLSVSIYKYILFVVSIFFVRTNRLSLIAVVYLWKTRQWAGSLKAILVSNFAEKTPAATRLSSLDPYLLIPVYFSISPLSHSSLEGKAILETEFKFTSKAK